MLNVSMLKEHNSPLALCLLLCTTSCGCQQGAPLHPISAVLRLSSYDISLTSEGFVLIEILTSTRRSTQGSLSSCSRLKATLLFLVSIARSVSFLRKATGTGADGVSLLSLFCNRYPLRCKMEAIRGKRKVHVRYHSIMLNRAHVLRARHNVAVETQHVDRCMQIASGLRLEMPFYLICTRWAPSV